MSAKDPQATTGTGVYRRLGVCATPGCGHSEAFHRFGTRAGRKIRTRCTAFGCLCGVYQPPVTSSEVTPS